MTNGSRLQATITLVCAVFTAGVIWHRISANAASMRETLEEIRTEQRAMAAKLETLLKK
jgi:hypothetical protein